MARVLPDGWNQQESSGTARRIVETLRTLSTALDEHYTLYHGVHWTHVADAHSVFGDIHLIVVNRSGDLLLIELAPGLLEETGEGLVKRYPGRNRSLVVQMARNVDALQIKLAARADCSQVRIEYLLLCPDYRVREPATAGIALERIVDSLRAHQLAEIIQQLLPAGSDNPAANGIHRFLRDQIRLETDVSALVGQAQALVTRVSGGLAHWARQLDANPFRLRVQATAGAGKTQLALSVFQDTIACGQRPLYLCFNRPLADHMARITPPGGFVGTFHHLCDQLLRSHGQTPEFGRPDAFERMVDQAETCAIPDALCFDTVIIDEGQDFSPRWRDLALRHARPDARLWWLEDPMQQLYPRPEVDLPGWITLQARQNFRSPRPVVRLLQTLLPDTEAIEAASPIDAGEVGLHVYDDNEGLLQGIKNAIRACYAAGFRHEDVAVLSFPGRERSSLTGLDRIGPHRLRHFNGRYDLLGHPEYTDGDVLLESVPRFKGQSAPAVVLAEVDFETFDERSLRRFFVGATRATLRLEVVLSRRAADQLGDALPSQPSSATLRK